MSAFESLWPRGAVLTIAQHPEGVQFSISGPAMVTTGVVIKKTDAIEAAGEVLAFSAPELAGAINGDPLAFLEAALSKMLGPPPDAFTAKPLPRCEELVGHDTAGAGVQCELPKGHLGAHQVRGREGTDPGVLS